MATKTKRQSKRSTAKKSSAKRSRQKGIAHSFPASPFEPKSKVGLYDAFGLNPEGVPPGKPIKTVSVKADSSLDFQVPKKGAYVLVNDDGRRLNFHVK